MFIVPTNPNPRIDEDPMVYLPRLSDPQLIAFLDGLVLSTFVAAQEPTTAGFNNSTCADCGEKYYDDGEPGMATCPNCGGCDRG